MATAQATTNHDEIRRWVEKRGGHPARVKVTGRRGDPGILRIDFPGFSGEETLEEIDWDDFFASFDRNKLAMLLGDGRSRFNKIVDRTTATRGGAKKASAKKSSAKKSAAKRGASTKRSAATKSSSKKSAVRASSAKKSNARKASAKRKMANR